jgi:hypothetical protein
MATATVGHSMPSGRKPDTSTAEANGPAKSLSLGVVHTSLDANEPDRAVASRSNDCVAGKVASSEETQIDVWGFRLRCSSKQARAKFSCRVRVVVLGVCRLLKTMLETNHESLPRDIVHFLILRPEFRTALPAETMFRRCVEESSTGLLTRLARCNSSASVLLRRWRTRCAHA